MCKVLLQNGREKLCKMVEACYPDAIKSALTMLEDGTAYLITGDITLMWLRDSANQLFQYLDLVREDPHLQIISSRRSDTKANTMDQTGSLWVFI